jgi:hypothetical protein
LRIDAIVTGGRDVPWRPGSSICTAEQYFQKTQRTSGCGTARDGNENGPDVQTRGHFISRRLSGLIAAEAQASEIFDE